MNACTLTHLGSALDEYSRERPPRRPRGTEPPGREVSDQNARCCSGGQGSGGFVSTCVDVKRGAGKRDSSTFFYCVLSPSLRHPQASTEMLRENNILTLELCHNMVRTSSC